MVYKVPIVERHVIEVSSFVVLDSMLDRKSKQSVEPNDELRKTYQANTGGIVEVEKQLIT